MADLHDLGGAASGLAKGRGSTNLFMVAPILQQRTVVELMEHPASTWPEVDRHRIIERKAGRFGWPIFCLLWPIAHHFPLEGSSKHDSLLPKGLGGTMWWEPTSDYERVLAQDVRSVTNWHIESSDAREMGCFGTGSIWSPDHDALVPVIFLRDFPISWVDWISYQPVKKWWLFRLNPTKDYPFPYTKLPLHIAAFKEPRATNSALSDAMSTATCITTDRIMDAFVRIRDPIICGNTGRTGTAGVVAFHYGTPVLLTAGHTFSGVDANVSRLRSRWPHIGWLRSSKKLPLGVVTHHRVTSPNEGPGWDVAAIRCRNDKEWPVAPLVTKFYRQFQSAEKVRVHGAYSGLVTRAVVQGACTILGNWKNCWMIAPSGLLREGDSGAAVFVERDASLLGMYVAKSELPGTGLALFHYVQDAFTLETEVLRGWDISFRIGG